MISRLVSLIETGVSFTRKIGGCLWIIKVLIFGVLSWFETQPFSGSMTSGI